MRAFPEVLDVITRIAGGLYEVWLLSTPSHPDRAMLYGVACQMLRALSNS